MRPCVKTEENYGLYNIMELSNLIGAKKSRYLLQTFMF